ncbi:staphylopine family metallophore export MFS transporter CntE [Rossellomorea vietnamensis]|uniref:staphylopine family metallophore export MFS transporter CntE n=1 Tax=Rossellomorea vietnamensis TaxID=218284 RepID=UPI001E49F4EF|nr:MFS transporter [Rossellomorea vietnamensis]MCC5801680.1 MFS transporter [Rossellomorea vietnamensis]
MHGALSWPFLRLYVVVLCYFSANAILNVLIPLQGKEWGASNTTIGLVMGAYLFTTMFFRPWAGHIIQKHGPTRILRIILVLNGLALALYVVSGLGGYLLARMLQGVATAFFSMAMQIGIMDALPEKDRSQGISLYSLFSYIPGILGPLLAIGIWQEGMDSFGYVMIGLAVVTGLFGYTAKLETNETEPLPEKNGKGGKMLASFTQLVKNPFLFKCSVIMLGSSIIFGAITTFIPLYALQMKSGSAGVFLMLQAATVVFARFTFRKYIPSDGKWHSPFVMGTMLLLAMSVLCISSSQTFGRVPFYVGAVGIGMAQALIYPTLTTYLSFVLPKVERNVLLGLFIATADLGVSLGGVLMGPLADLSSYSFMYGMCAVLGGIMIIFSFQSAKFKTIASE